LSYFATPHLYVLLLHETSQLLNNSQLKFHITVTQSKKASSLSAQLV